jgi:Peptidase propeptide and YPEB domain
LVLLWAAPILSGPVISRKEEKLNVSGLGMVQSFMKTRGAVLALGFVMAASGLSMAEARSSKGQLMKQASLDRHEAEKIALTSVAHGVVKSVELEKEHGKLVWSFDIARPGTKEITEVQVDAKTGQIVLVENETPAQQAAEAQADKAKK